MRLTSEDFARMLAGRRWAEKAFKAAAFLSLFAALGTAIVLLMVALIDGWPRLNWSFLTSYPSRRASQAGILAALAGTAWLMALTAVFAFPLGVGAAIYLEEYARKSWFARIVEINIANLAGVPSIIYGLLGLELFVRWMGFGRSLLAGALTMALLVLPIVIISTREALRTVPPSIREASFALGASQWQTIWRHVLPLAFPGILTGSILAFSRAIGEAAPLITLGALTFIAFLPDSIMSPFTALPIQIYNWVSRPQKDFHANAAAGIIVLLVVLLAMNALAVFLRQRYQKRY